MGNKYISFDIDDPRSAAIAEAMSNNTSKKILSLIAEREMSAGDISSELHLPINTIGYNIEKLLKAGLIEKSKNYFWSAKGKKILTYTVSNKKILISPKKMSKGVIPAVILSGLLSVGIKYYLESKKVIGSTLDLAYQKSAEVATLAASSAASTASGTGMAEVSRASDYGWLWFLSGAVVCMIIFLVWNKLIKMKGGNENE